MDPPKSAMALDLPLSGARLRKPLEALRSGEGLVSGVARGRHRRHGRHGRYGRHGPTRVKSSPSGAHTTLENCFTLLCCALRCAALPYPIDPDCVLGSFEFSVSFSFRFSS